MPYHIRGHVLPEGDIRDLYVADGRISFEPVAGAETIVEAGYIVPGLVDTHAHLALASPGEGDLPDLMEASARAHLDAGVLLVRDPGGPGHDGVTFGPARGLPRVINAGRFLAPHGGYFPGLAREIDPDALADAAEEEATASGAWAKVIGDFVGPDGHFSANFELRQLRAASQRVHELGARITMHAMTADAIGQAIDAGFDGIEHGTEATPELAEAMAEHGMAWVPTLDIEDALQETVRVIAPGEIGRWVVAVDRLRASVRHAARIGVRILAGTDAGMVPHGRIRDEVRRLVEVGVPAEQALGAASWDARAYLGLPGIEAGAPADLVIFERDPRAEVDSLPAAALCLLDGRLVARGSLA